MQCHNTDVILSARFSNKPEPLLGLLWQYEQYTWRYVRAARDVGVSFQCDTQTASPWSHYTAAKRLVNKRTHTERGRLCHSCEIFSIALHTSILFCCRANTEILAGIQFKGAAIRVRSSCVTVYVFQSGHSTLSLCPQLCCRVHTISRDLRQKMLSGLLSDLVLLTLSVWPLAYNLDWTPKTSRSYT